MLPGASRGRNEAGKQLVDWLAWQGGGMSAGLCLQGCGLHEVSQQCMWVPVAPSAAPTHSPAAVPPPPYLSLPPVHSFVLSFSSYVSNLSQSSL